MHADTHEEGPEIEDESRRVSRSSIDRYSEWGFTPEVEVDETRRSTDSIALQQHGLEPIHEDRRSYDGVPPKRAALAAGLDPESLAPPWSMDFSLMDFVKKLRQENQQILEEYKHELREQLVNTLKDEAGGILKTFAAAMLESRRDIAEQEAMAAAPPQPKYGRKAKRPERESPSPEVLQHRVALNILQGMTASLGEAQVAKALAARPTGQRLSSAPASSSRGAVPSSSRAGSAAGGARGQPKHSLDEKEQQRIANYMSASPFYPADRGESGGEASAVKQRPMTTPALQQSGEVFPLDGAYDGEEEGPDAPEPRVDERTARLLSQSEQLLGDATVARARAATAVGSSRRGLALPTVPERRPGTALEPGSGKAGGAWQRLDTAPASLRSGVRGMPPPAAGLGDAGPLLPPSPGKRAAQSVSSTFPPPSSTASAESRESEASSKNSCVRLEPVMGAQQPPRPSTTMATGRPSSRHPTMPAAGGARGGAMMGTTMRRAGDVLPAKLGDEEWENEVARNILTLYVSTVKDQSQKAGASMTATTMIREGGPATAVTATTSTADAVETGLAYGAASKKRPATTPANLPTRGVEARASSSRAGHGRATTAQHKTRDAPPATWPAIDPTTGRRAGLVPRTVASLGHYRIAVQRRNGSGESFVMIPRIPHTIWFAGTGTNRADWSTVPGATASWLTQLQRLDGSGAYAKYLVLTEAMLATALRACDSLTLPPQLRLLWRQLVVTANNFAVRAIEAGQYALALALLQKAGELCDSHVQGGRGPILLKRTRKELQAFIMDSHGFYYYRRKKYHAALSYVQRAMHTHAAHRNWAHVAACHLHSSCILAKMEAKVAEGLRCMSQVLAMVEDGKLDVGGPTTQKVALVAVCYHNMAALYLRMRNLGEAFMCSQNARRLSRLSLAYSNRWTEQFEHTHKVVLSEIAAKYKYVDRIIRDKDQEYLFSALLTAM